MSEENQLKTVNEVDSQENTHPETAGSPPAKKQAEPHGFTPPVLLLLFAVVALFIILVLSLTIEKTSRQNKAMTLEDPSLAALKADIEARRMDLNRQRIESGLPPLEGGSEPIEEVAARLKQDANTLTSLSKRFQQLLTEKDAQINEASDQLLISEQVRQSLSNELAQLRQNYQKALISSSEAESLKAQLESARNQRQAMSEELFTLRQQLSDSQGSVSQAQYSDLEQRYKEAANARDFFENRVKELEAQLQKRNLFAKSEDDLLPSAAELFSRLRLLEGSADSDLTAEYSKLGIDLGANLLHTLSFPTGSSELSAQDRQRLQNAIDETPDGDLTLIIGYASTTGEPIPNQKLSSDRATIAAEYFAEMKRNGQLVQAVYLGQTDRFSSSSPESNQICEIWRIRQK